MYPNDTTDAPQKTCSKCGESKPATSEYFDRHKSMNDGFQRICKACRAEYRAANRERLAAKARERHAANREHLNEISRSYYAAHKEQASQNGRIYRQTNRERIREYRRIYYLANKEQLTARNQAYRAANKGRFAEYGRAYRAANKSYMANYNRAYRQANKGELSEKKRAYYLDNQEYFKEKSRVWRIANPERAVSTIHKWHATHPEKKREYSTRRLARQRNAEGFHTAEDIQRQYKAQKGKCYYCKAQVGDTYHVDHVVPLSRGGSNWPENLVIACVKCNSSKKDRLPHEWIQGGRLL